MGIATYGRHQHRQACDQRLEQHSAGVFVVGRVNQQVGTKQKTRDIAASFQELHLIAQAQRRALQLEHLGVVLANHHQPGALAQPRRQCGQGLEATVDTLGLEAGADLHHQ
ncbi:hypothetical protein D9M70_652270 [compost metagenome]